MEKEYIVDKNKCTNKHMKTHSYKQTVAVYSDTTTSLITYRNHNTVMKEKRRYENPEDVIHKCAT